MSRGLVCALTAAMVCGVIAPTAQAALLRVQAPDTCVEAASIGEQVDVLLGAPLSAVEGVDFELLITRGADRRWQLRLETIAGAAGNRRTRELTAGGCAELADAAAVAIALSIKSAQTQTEEPQAPSTPPVPEVATPAPSPPVSAASPPADAARSSSTRKALALSAVFDAGAMPRPAFGIGLDGSLELTRLRLVASGALFPSQETRQANGTGGDFQLAVASALACFTQGLARFSLMVCAGGEAGRLTGEGIGVAVSRSQGALWLAARGAIGGSLRLTDNLALVVQAGTAVPRRPTFVLDGATAVHQPSSLTFRAAASVELGF